MNTAKNPKNPQGQNKNLPLYKAIVRAIPDMLFRVNGDGTYIEYIHEDNENLLVSPEEFIGKKIMDIMPEQHSPNMMECLENALLTGKLQIYEYSLAIKGEHKSFEARFVSYDDNEVLVIVRDITDQKILEEDLHHLAHYDSLTGLPNRVLFFDRLEHAIDLAKRNRYQIVVMMIDTDDFKNINDTYGHEAGDIVLQEIARRLSSSVRISDTVARLGGDEFGMILENIENDLIPKTIAEKIISAFSSPVQVNGDALVLTVSIGISISAGDKDTKTMLKNADQAMYQVKNSVKGGYRIY